MVFFKFNVFIHHLKKWSCRKKNRCYLETRRTLIKPYPSLVFQSNPPYSTLFLPNSSLLIPKYLEMCFVCDVHPTIIKLISSL